MTAPIAELFDRVADTYDAVGVPWFTPIATGLVQALATRPGEHAVDLGCGKGAALLPLAEAVGTGGSVTGVDLAPAMVRAAQAAVDERGLVNVDLLVGDVMAPDLPPASFDVAASSLVLFFLPDPAAAVRAWLSLLRPGGRLGVATFGASDPRDEAVTALFGPYLPPAMRDARTTGGRGPFASDAGMAALLHDAGLAEVRTVHTTVTAVARDLDHWHEFSWSHGQRGMWERVPPGERDRVRRAAYAILEPTLRTDGALELTQDVRYTLGVRPD